MGGTQKITSRIYLIGAPDHEGCYKERVKTKKHQQALESQRERKTDELSLHKLSLKDHIKMFPLPHSNSHVSVELPISGHLSYGVVDKLLFYSI